MAPARSGREDGLVVGVGREHNDLRPRMLGAHATCRFDAVDVRHPHILRHHAFRVPPSHPLSTAARRGAQASPRGRHYAIAGTTIGSATDLQSALLQHKPGQTVNVTWTDQSGQSHTANVTLASGPAL